MAFSFFEHKKKTILRGYKVVRYSVYLLAFFLVALSLWINKYFGKPNLEQVLYHLSFGAEGLFESDPALISKFIKWCVVWPILLTFIAYNIEHPGFIKKIFHASVPKIKRLFPLMKRGMPVIFLLLATHYWMKQVSGFAYIKSYFGSDYFSSNYVPPDRVELKPNNPKNLVLIYVEGLENTYSDTALFNRDLLTSLHKLQGVKFDSFREAPGTGFTIAGIVATQCGLPLKRVGFLSENNQGRTVKSFLPNATCLSDILSKFGYQNIFMGGASLTFAGKGKFLQDHNYHQMYGREEWAQLGIKESEMEGWGLRDDDLFEQAKLKLKQLQTANQPFNLTILTVDTHHPRGFVSKKCAKRGVNDFEEIVKCTADEVAEFVNFIKLNGYLKNTNIVIVGDHLAMRNSVYEKLALVPERHIFNNFISANKPEKNREAILHFDLLPTILEFIGIDVIGDRLGLGYSAFNPLVEQPNPNRLKEMEDSLFNSSVIYSNLWKEKKELAAPGPRSAMTVGSRLPN